MNEVKAEVKKNTKTRKMENFKMMKKPLKSKNHNQK